MDSQNDISALASSQAQTQPQPYVVKHPEAQEFLKIASQFKLGSLDTEKQHPLTMDLSYLAKHNLPEAYEALKAVDIAALEKFCQQADLLPALAAEVAETLQAGGKIYLCGCGATGRLSLTLEVLAREGLLPEEYRERVVGFMAGGDLALIKAIERFEDRPEFGARQLQELGFADGDLLISSTEGGETPFVIGATEFAAQHSRRSPWFLYCNPDAPLAAAAERSQRVLANPQIRKLNLAVGPMAISGSTRMQASTVLMAAIGICFENMANPADAALGPQKLLELTWTIDFPQLAGFTEREALVYDSKNYVLYEPGVYGMTVLTDTTERAPTFTLLPFENQLDPQAKASWCHLWMQGQHTGAEAWKKLLHRAPRALEWEDVKHVAGAQVLEGYNFSDEMLPGRDNRTHSSGRIVFTISDEVRGVRTNFKDLEHLIYMPEATPLYRHLVLKMILNAHSTLVMGRLGRYEDNLMTYVKPSNNKLIDRAIRYVQQLLARQYQIFPSYENVADVLFQERDLMAPDEAIVLRTKAALLRG